MAFHRFSTIYALRTHRLSMAAGRSCSWRDSGLSGAPMKSASSARFQVSLVSSSVPSGTTTQLRSRGTTGELVRRANNPL